MISGQHNNKKQAKGQVLLLGVAVLVVLLICALLMFDLHNAIRAKIKVESAQQAAALAGSQWQVAGLNMIGELNIVKACTLMLDEDSEIEATPFVPPENSENLTPEQLEYLAKKHRLASRVRTLNEAQSRVAFILPLLGYAAVQQTAKQNGMGNVEPALQYYYEEALPMHDHKDKAIQGYFWYEPYRRLIKTILDQKAVVRCNARISELPEVWSNAKGGRRIATDSQIDFSVLLSDESLYDSIESGNFCHWQLIRIAKAGVYLDHPWWKITYTPGQFIGQSEILPLGVKYGGGVDIPSMQNSHFLQNITPPGDWNLDPTLQPATWCLYDWAWYASSWTKEAYDSQQTNWRGGRWLRNDRRPGFLYEGAVAAVDGAVKSARVMTFQAQKQRTDVSQGQLSINAPIKERKNTTGTVGRTSTSRSVNLGVVAKVYGGFNDLSSMDDSPIATPLILPVFKQGLMIPSAMPYKVSMMTVGDDSLKKFLQWLATWPDIDHSNPPDGTEWYLFQLRKLMDPDFILSIYNKDFPGLESLSLMDLMGDDYYYPEHSDGAGWLQRAYKGFSKTCPQTVRYTGKRFKCGQRDCELCKREPQWVKKSGVACGTWETYLEPAVQDDVPTELPQTYVDEKGVEHRYYTDYSGLSRIYYGNKKNGYRYCVRRNGRIQTNEDISCNGHLYVPPGGNMPLGVESGPTRL